jgi:hypothetical protein
LLIISYVTFSFVSSSQSQETKILPKIQNWANDGMKPRIALRQVKPLYLRRRVRHAHFTKDRMVYWVDPTNKLYKTSMDRGGREIYLIFRDFYFMWLYNDGRDSIHPNLSYDSQFIHKSHQSKHAITNKQFTTYHICREFV